VLFHHAIPDRCQFVAIHPVQAKVLGFLVVKEEITPLFGGVGSWIMVKNVAIQQMIDSLDMRAFHWLEFVALQLFEFCRRNPEEVITMRWLHAQLKDLENAQPGLVSESLDRYGISVSRLLSVIHQLLREGLPILNLQRLVEDVSTFYSSAHSTEVVDEQFNMVELVVFLRHRHRERLMGYRKQGERPMRIIRMTPGVEALFLRAGSQLLGGSLQMSRAEYRNLREALENLLQAARARGVLPIAIQCPGFLRVPVFHFLHSLAYTVPMFCDDEISLEHSRVIAHDWSLSGDT
jgi:flagellar biosynthesis component FlhA